MEERCAALAQGGNRRDPAGPAAAHDSALPAPHPGPGAPAPAPASDWVENRATSLRTHSRLSFSSADGPLVTHLTGLGVSHSFQSAHSLLISFLLENNLLQKKKKHARIVQAFSHFFLSLFSFSSSPSGLPFSSFSFFFPSLSSFLLLSSVLFLTVLPTFVSLSIPTCLFPHPYFSASPPSISVTSLGLSPRALRYSLLGVSGDGIPRKGSRSRLPSSSQATAGCRLKCPQDSSVEAFPHHPERALCVPNFPGISRRPRRTMPHIVSPILSGGHLTHLLQTLLILP